MSAGFDSSGVGTQLGMEWNQSRELLAFHHAGQRFNPQWTSVLMVPAMVRRRSSHLALTLPPGIFLPVHCSSYLTA